MTTTLAPRLAGADASPVPGLLARAIARLRAVGIRPGDRVLLSGGNSAAYVAAVLALAHLDASIVLLDRCHTAAQARAAVDRSRVRWVLRDQDGGDGGDGDLGVASHRELPLAELCASAPGGDSAAATMDAWWRRRDAVILWSSGTTGPAKGVVKSGPSLWDNTVRTRQALQFRDDDVLAPWLPFSHQYGLSLVLLWWQIGCTLAITPYRRLDRAVRDVIRYGATVVDATPATYYTLLRLIRRQPRLRTELGGVRIWGVGGAPLPAPTAEAFRAALGRPLLNGYGLTEAGNVALATPANPIGCGSPLPGVAVRIADSAGGPAPAGELGEIEVRTAGLMTGYLGGRGAAAGGWYRTNDLGYLDRHGNLHVVGRRHAVHRLGHTLYPEHIERRAEEVCGRPVRVLAVDDERRGASLIFVVCDPDGGAPKQWRERLRDRLPRHEQPNRVHVVDELPVGATGKVDLAQLRHRVAQAAGEGRASRAVRPV